jgi:CheY-like chemotaxis protein
LISASAIIPPHGTVVAGVGTDDDTEHGRVHVEQIHSSGSAATQGMVLIVEDNHDLRHVMHELVGMIGFAADLAGDGEEALALLGDNEYDAVICDLSMPKMCGDEVYLRCRERRPEAARRFVFCSGSLPGSRLANFADATGQPFLGKPCPLDAIRAAINRVAPPTAERRLEDAIA